MLFVRAGSCNLQVSALSSLTPGSPSGMHYLTTPGLLSKAGSFSYLWSFSSLVVYTASAPRCRCGVQGSIDALSMNCGPLYLMCKAVWTA